MICLSEDYEGGEFGDNLERLRHAAEKTLGEDVLALLKDIVPGYPWTSQDLYGGAIGPTIHSTEGS